MRSQTRADPNQLSREERLTAIAELLVRGAIAAVGLSEGGTDRGSGSGACDLFTVTTATLRTYYVVFFIEIATRRINCWNLSEHPDDARVAQQFCNLSILHDDLPRHLLHDRDSKFTRRADALLHSQGTKPIRLPVRSPNLNAHAERWIWTVRGECLDRIIILNERHLRWVLEEYVRYYNERRPHRSLQLRVPQGPRVYPREGRVVSRPILGGLTHNYYRGAA